jgi:hypothetical protein
MTKPLIVLSAVCLTAAAIIYCRKVSQIKQEQARTTETRQQLVEVEAESSRQLEENKLLKEELRHTRSQASSQANDLRDLNQRVSSATTLPVPSAPRPGAELLKDPRMRATFKKQQLENVERSVNKVVNGDLIAHLNLNPQQSSYLKDLLRKKYTPGAEITMELMTGDLSDSELGARGHQFKQQNTGGGRADQGIHGRRGLQNF